MFKQIQTIDVLAAPRASNVDPVVAKRNASMAFRVMHGYYGSLFQSKFATGKVDAQGRDEGVLSARAVWAERLSRFSEQVIADALARCEKDHPKFPPSLPEFVSLCRACMPVAVHRQDGPAALTMGKELHSAYTSRARAIVAKHDAKARERAAGSFRALPADVVGLDALKYAIADAVSCGGGDDAVELLRLDRLLCVKGAA